MSAAAGMPATVDPVMPRAPRARLPDGACDTHAHVFGPYDQFPLAHAASYPLPLAPAALHASMLATVGATRGVLVQPAPYGCDPGAVLAALRRASGRLRGIAVADAAVGEPALRRWAEAGIRGLRFVEMRDPNGNPYKGSVGADQLVELAPLMRRLGLHAQLWASADDYLRLLPRLLPLGVPLVLDHMGSFDAGRGVADAAFAHLLDRLRSSEVWIKMSLCRVSKQGPDYPDIRPFHDAMVAANSARLLWGSDWPFVRMGAGSPDVGALLDLFYEWVPDSSLRTQILVDNPARLYGFDDAPVS
jgi:2-pyrone-4,6-dicarboxylate lactonase